MALSTIDRVKAAELAANEARENAALEAKRILDDAQAQADALIADAKAKAAENENAQAAQAQAKADTLVKERREKAQQEADALRDKTMKLRQNVINKLIQETLA